MVHPMYTQEEIQRYTKTLAGLGITKEEEVKAVLDFIHSLVCIAVKEYRQMANRV